MDKSSKTMGDFPASHRTVNHPVAVPTTFCSLEPSKSFRFTMLFPWLRSRLGLLFPVHGWQEAKAADVPRRAELADDLGRCSSRRTMEK